MPLYWLGAGILGLLLLTSRKARAAAALPDAVPDSPTPPPAPTEPKVTYGEAQMVTPFPAGYRRLRTGEVTPELIQRASAIRSSPGFTSLAYGTVIPIDETNAALVEQHYHEPGGPVKPWGYHHGVTLIART